MKPGIYDNLPIEKYHAYKHIISSTGLKKAKKSSRDFAMYVQSEQETKSCFDFGNVFEIMLIDAVQGTIESENVVWVYDDMKRPEPDKNFNSTKNKQWRSEQEDKNKGKYRINRHGDESLDTINEMIDSVLARPVLSRLLENVHYQKSFFWVDDDTGLLCKTRPDVSLVNKRVITNIKTTKDASPDAFSRDARKFDYPLQACMEMEGAIKSGYVDAIDIYYWLAVQKVPPYHAELYEFDPKDISFAYDQMHYYLARCKKAIDQIDNSDGDLYKVDGFFEDATDKHGILTLDLKYYQP